VSELALTLLRLGFLTLLWVFVLLTVLVLRRDLSAPREARPIAPAPAPRAPREPKGRAKPPKPPKVKGASLVVVEGPLTGTVVPLGTAAITIGRAPDSTLVIDDDYASSRHARIVPSQGAWLVEDLGSTNGTWIDRQRITAPTILAIGAPLRIGRTTVKLTK
jgi:pSer/pThr/pTyr-binding forkhead associated (FHA) protein